MGNYYAFCPRGLCGDVLQAIITITWKFTFSAGIGIGPIGTAEKGMKTHTLRKGKKTMKKFHTVLLVLAAVLILFSLGAFLVHLQMFLSAPTSAPKTEIPVVVGFDWTERHSHRGYAPFFMCQGRLFSSDYNHKQIGLSNAALMSEEGDINGMKYPGFSIVGRSVEDKTERTVFSFHFRTMQDDRGEDYVEMYIDANVEFAIAIDNFENGILCDVNTAGAYEKPYRFRAGRYHLQALEKRE
ncbi:MAG TPA: hypothetical protein PLV55_07410 [Anaerohalosphaeraceae bacterium]|nr:hypothetical protein [Anaerohalosphaeraceae bacterium]